MFAKFNNWLLKLTNSSYAVTILAIISFSESSFFPIPPDLLLIPLILAKPHNAFKYALITTVFSVLGGGFGYIIGNQLFELIGEPIVIFYDNASNFEIFTKKYNEYGGLAILIAGVSPFPYKVTTIVSGVTGMPIVMFLGYSTLARGARFFLIATLLYFFGSRLRVFIEKYLGILLLVVMLFVILGFFFTSKL